MGFGVSGSTAIIFLGVLVCTGTLYTAAAGSAEQLTDAQHADNERVLEQRNTDIEITSATYTEINNSTDYSVTLLVENTGTTTLSVNDSSVLVDNEYLNRSRFYAVSVDGVDSTDIWAPGQTLSLAYEADEEPETATVVTGYGVSDTNETVVS